MARTPARQAAPAASHDGEAEALLIEVYRLIGASRSREALAKAEHLASRYPNFQLAQLVYGDLLAGRTRPLRRLGDIADGMPAAMVAQLDELRQESQLRLKALRERPPAHTIPSQFLTLAPRSRHAIAVDASRSRLYLFENTANGLQLVADYYISLGKSGIEKSVEGDLRTPLGVYYITGNLNKATLKDFYGAGALPINYPNPLDLSRGKTGGGIWLHGTPRDQFSRAPLTTDGCVVLANPALERILRTVEPRSTPVVIASHLQWVAPLAVQPESRAFEGVLDAWRAAKSSGDMDRLLAFYTPDFKSYGKSLAEWTPQLAAEAVRAEGREIRLKDLSLLRWNDKADTMVVTFGEVLDGARTGAVKRQYWLRQGGQWKIFFEGVIGDAPVPARRCAPHVLPGCLRARHGCRVGPGRPRAAGQARHLGGRHRGPARCGKGAAHGRELSAVRARQAL
ncbi:MAG: hypothetical protein GAK38_02146 [Xylophilus sp.]|nr:MAG: hypothetical protein GAK38_02146 [Xylophilus sp.]